MKKAYLLSIGLMFVLGAAAVLAVSLDELEYPIEELGGCRSEAACLLYCEDGENKAACLDFAQANGLMPEEAARKARAMLELGAGEGPGGCGSQAECQTYCADLENLEECLGFAKKYRLMDEKELKQAEQVGKALALGQKMPGGCNGKKDCEAYCALEDNLDECVEFAEAIGLMNGEEAKLMRQTNGKGPGECRGKKACEAYCEEPDNLEECLAFGLDKGLMPLQNSEQARKVLLAIRSGAKPPHCKRSECEAYCQEPDSAEECVDFAEAAGLMNKDEAKEARRRLKAGKAKGPGGCQGEEECAAYCREEANADECLGYRLDNGEISQEEYDDIAADRARRGQEGPGGCQGKAACDAYCAEESNQAECADYLLEQGEIGQEERDRLRAGLDRRSEGGPGGCTTHEECEEYCADPARAEECQAYAPAGDADPDAPAPPSPGKIRNQAMEDLEAELGPLPPAPGALPGADSGAGPEEADCAQFAAAPDCSYVPENARAACEQCRN